MDMDDDDFVFPGFADDMEPPPAVDPELPVPPVKALTDLEIDRWSCWVKPFPLPPHATPTEPIDWSDVSDDMLMKMPPSVIVHMQRTAAQGGLQVVSPRQVPFSTLMGRTMDTKRDICDYVVGSVADPDDEWPTIDGANFEKLLPDQPLPPRGTNVAEREKTRTEPLTSAAHLVKDPILSCLIKGRAVIDVLRRDDVAGDADGTAEVLAYAWGIPTEQLMDLDAFTLGLDGPLLRHALRTDSVFPMVHAPIHQKMSVSVSNSELNRELLPEGSAMDWRRMRVFCEAIFLLTCAVESIPLKAIRCNPPPGDPSAPLCRPNIIGFRPLPCTAWTCEPSSFSIFPIWDKRSGVVRAIPSEVLEAMSDYTKQVRPMSYVMSMGHESNVRKAYASEIMHAAEETLVTGYSLARFTVATGGARGRTAAATVRNVIFEVLENSPMQLRLRLARTLLITREEVKVHLATDVVPDGIIDRISYRLVAIGEPLRVKIAAEAARRCSSLDAWWGDITSQTPERYARMAEGTMGWARVAIWLLFRSPTDKWERLKSATHFSALRAAELGAVRGIGLPPERGSVERMTTAARAYVSGITKAYAGYYSAPYDVGMSIADELESRSLTRSADTMREGAYMWMMRARSLRATNVHAITHGTPNRSPNHLRIKGERFDMTIVPAPYRAFAAWKAHVEQSKLIHKAAKKEILDYKDTKISSLFSKFSYPLAPARASVVTRYLITPSRLGIDMEKSWGMLAQDVARVLATMDDEDKKIAKMLAETAPVAERRYVSITDLNLEIPRLLDDGTAKRYDYWCGHMDCDEMDWMEEVLRQAGTAIEMDIRSRFFMSLAEVRTYMLELDKENEKIMLASLETVG